MGTQTQHKWQLLFEYSSDAMVIVDKETAMIIDANPKAQQLFAHPLPFLVKSCFSDFLLSDSPEEWTHFFKMALLGLQKHLDVKIITKNYDIVPVQLTAHTFELEAQNTHLLLFIKETTSTEQKIKALERQLHFYETILMQMPTEFAVLNSNWQYLFINKNSIKDDTLREWMIGKTDYDFCEYRYKDMTIAENRQKQYKELARTKTGKEWIDEHPQPDGKTKFVLRKLYPYFVDGQLEMNFGFGIDVTESVQAERERKAILNELRQQNEELKQFAYITTHDLKEPLRNIASFTNLLQRRIGKDLNQDAREFMDYIIGNAKRMNDLLNALKSYVTIDKIELQKDVVNLNTVVNNALANLQLLIQETKTVIEVEELPRIIGHRAYLNQLFQNLINNAIKFCHQEPHITIKVETEDNCYRFYVKDNGIGIHPDYHEKVFKIFNRLDKQNYDGTGMGLAICKKIVQLHYGKIWIESDGQNGTTFVFELKRVRGGDI